MADNVQPDPPPPPFPDEVVATQPVTPIPPTAPPPHQGCMDKRSGLEKVLIVIIIIVLLILLGFIAAFLVFYFFATPPEGTCLTEECVKSASRIKRYMNDSAKPCDDFYQYACGGWLKSQTLDSHEVKIGLESTISDENRIKIRAILERPISSTDAEYQKQAKLFYNACMNTGKMKERGKEPFFKLLATIGKFPSFDDTWNETDFNLENILIKLTKLAVMPLFTIDVGRDLKSTAVNRIYISDSGSVKTPFKAGRADTRVRSYEKLLVDSLVLLGVNRSEAEQDIKDVVDLEIRITKLIRPDEEKGDISARYNLMTIAMLQSKCPWFKWLEYLQGIAASPTGGGVYISVEEQIINFEPVYLEKLGVVLGNTTKRVLANLLMTNLITFTSALGPEFIALSDNYNRETLGVEPKPRFEFCVSKATTIYPESVSRMYVDQHFPKDAKTYMDVMIKDLVASFSQLLDENTWMTAETKKKAHEKLKQMKPKVGYPAYMMDDERLNKLYATIPANEEEYIETVIAFRQYMITERVKGLREPRDKDKWPVHAAMVNAYYDILSNEIIFPAAFLQEPVYSPEYTSSMNYGAIGMIIGHEITHGFDNIGRSYTAIGELSDWWTPADSDNYKSRTDCFVDQYDCYKWDKYSLDGKKTLSENIADNGGLKQSFRAYRNLIKRLGSEELRLPGLKLNHNQIFFLSFAQVWCSKYRDEQKKEVVESDVHSPSPYRVLGTLQNSQEFADTFKCPQGRRMNPLRKCVLW